MMLGKIQTGRKTYRCGIEGTRKVSKHRNGELNMNNIPEEVMREIDFMLGSIEECNSEWLLPILHANGIYPNGGWVDIDNVPDGVILDIYEKLFNTGIISPFYTKE